MENYVHHLPLKELPEQIGMFYIHSLHTYIFKELVAVLAMASVLLDFLSDTTLEIPASVLQPFHFYVLFVRKLELLTSLGFITKRQCYSERKCMN